MTNESEEGIIYECVKGKNCTPVEDQTPGYINHDGVEFTEDQNDDIQCYEVNGEKGEVEIRCQLAPDIKYIDDTSDSTHRNVNKLYKYIIYLFILITILL